MTDGDKGSEGRRVGQGGVGASRKASAEASQVRRGGREEPWFSEPSPTPDITL